MFVRTGIAYRNSSKVVLFFFFYFIPPRELIAFSYILLEIHKMGFGLMTTQLKILSALATKPDFGFQYPPGRL